MQTDSLADVLRDLAKGEKARSETARLKDVINEIEAALSAGVSRAAILETLHSKGFKMNMKSFESALYRTRKRTKRSERKNPIIGKQSSPLETKSNQDEQSGKDDNDEYAGLTAKQRRERIADKYVTNEPNPLIKRFVNKRNNR